MIQRRLLRGTVYLEIPIDWDDGEPTVPVPGTRNRWDDNMPPPVPLNQVLEDLVGKAIVRDSYPRLRDSEVTVEASDVELGDLDGSGSGSGLAPSDRKA